MRSEHVRALVKNALNEDIGVGDITTRILIPPMHKSRGIIFSKESAIICGVACVKEVFRQLDPGVRVVVKKCDGDRVLAGETIACLNGSSQAILTGERVALNYLSYLSAIATRTRMFCDIIRPYRARIMDTRKTTPGSRILERYAVSCGGGVNHRFDLGSMVLIKDNHRMITAGSLSLAGLVRLTRKRTRKKIEIEVDSLDQLEDALQASPDMVLLDNMSIGELKKAVTLVRSIGVHKARPLLEASGGVNLKNVRQIAATGVDRISIGALTHSRQAIDMSLEIL